MDTPYPEEPRSRDGQRDLIQVFEAVIRRKQRNWAGPLFVSSGEFGPAQATRRDVHDFRDQW